MEKRKDEEEEKKRVQLVRRKGTQGPKRMTGCLKRESHVQEEKNKKKRERKRGEYSWRKWHLVRNRKEDKEMEPVGRVKSEEKRKEERRRKGKQRSEKGVEMKKNKEGLCLGRSRIAPK